MIGLIIMILLVLRIRNLARESGKSSLVWILTAVMSYLGIQSIIAIVVLLAFSFFTQLNFFNRFFIPFIFFSEFFSLLGVWIIASYLDERKENNMQ